MHHPDVGGIFRTGYRFCQCRPYFRAIFRTRYRVCQCRPEFETVSRTRLAKRPSHPDFKAIFRMRSPKQPCHPDFIAIFRMRSGKANDGPTATGTGYCNKKSSGTVVSKLLVRAWQLPTLPPGGAVPSALVSLTSLFGMGRGGSSPL